MNILVFGDSIALGLWDENGGWVGKIDGVHPNNRGHDMIFKIAGRKLLNLFLPGSGRSREWR